METNEQRVRRMSGMFRAGSPPIGIDGPIALAGRKPDGPDRIYGPARQNIDWDFDDFSLSDGASGKPVAPDPFTVSYNGASLGTAQIKSTTASYLHKSRLASDSQGITGLNAAFSLSTDTHGWIEILVDADIAVTAAELKTGSGFPALVVTAGTPLAQTQYNLPVGRVVAGKQVGMKGFGFKIAGSDYYWQQLLCAHQLLLADCYSGTPILASNPWQGI